MTKEKHHEAHPAKPKAKKEPAHEKPHAKEQPYYEEPPAEQKASQEPYPEDHPPPPLPTGQEPQAPAGSRLKEEQKAGQDAVAKAEQGAHNKPPPHEEGT